MRTSSWGALTWLPSTTSRQPPPPGQGAGGPGRAWVRAPGHQAREAPPTRPARPASPGPWVEGAVLCVTPQQGRAMPSWGPGAGSAPPTPVYPLEGGLGRASNAPAPGGGESWNPPPFLGDPCCPAPPGRRCSCPGSSRTRRWRRRPATAWATRTRCCRTTSARRSTTSGTCSSPRSWLTGVRRGGRRRRPTEGSDCPLGPQADHSSLSARWSGSEPRSASDHQGTAPWGSAFFHRSAAPPTGREWGDPWALGWLGPSPQPAAPLNNTRPSSLPLSTSVCASVFAETQTD